VTRVEVRLELPSGPRTVGHLLDADRRIHFEYAPEFVATGLPLSPFKLPLRTGVFSDGFPEFHGLYGLFFDSLPDGWGLMLMHRRMRKRDIDPNRISALAWLQYMGTRAMGALSYHPADAPELEAPMDVALKTLAAEAVAVFEGRTDSVLPELEAAGSSPGGARPKAVVALGPKDRVLVGVEALPPGFEHWLVKFPAKGDLDDAGALEETYARMARGAGLRIPETRLLPLDKRRRCFAVKRFDRQGSTRVHMHSIGGLLHASHRLPSLDYADLLAATGTLTRSQAEVVEGFRRLCFNVLACNRDDHVRNFSYLMSAAGEWTFSPAYDLIYSEGMRGHHTTSVNGETLAPTQEHVMRIADAHGLRRKDALAMIDQVRSSVADFRRIARGLSVASKTVTQVARRLDEVAARFGGARRATPGPASGRRSGPARPRRPR
jgi:serine/threonine-protein kinase HipA